MAWGPFVASGPTPGYTLPTATAARLGGIKVGNGLTVGADGTLQLTKENITSVLGKNVAAQLDALDGISDKLTKLERMMNMEGKLVYTGTGTAYGHRTGSMEVPGTVDYIAVQMPDKANNSSTDTGVSVAADYGTTRIVRGGTAVALVSMGLTATITFASNGTLTIGQTGDTFDKTFNVEGYQYV